MNDTAQIKQYNIQLVRSALADLGQATKQQVSLHTNLSVSTCNTILNELEESGEVFSRKIRPNQVGRSAKGYQLNKNFSMVLGLHFKVSERKKVLYYAVMNLGGDPIIEMTQTCSVIDTAFLLEIIGKLIKEYPQISAISLGIPGIIRGDLITFCDVEELIGVNLSSTIHNAFEIPVVMENDMHIIAYGYYKKQCPENATVSIAIYPENILPGSGTVIDGKVLKGASAFAGQIGFMSYGMNHDSIKRLMDREHCFPIISQSIISLIAILNPDIIILTGDLIEEKMIPQLYAASLTHMDKQHIPELLYIPNIDTYYRRGLYSLAMENRKDTIKL